MRRKVTVIVPVYNEARYVGLVIDAVRSASLPHGLGKEIVVVDDGSTDGTREILNRYKGVPDVVLRFLDRNSGKGAAVREALKLATGDIVLLQDGDMEYSVADYGRLLEPFVLGNARVVYGSRFAGSIRDMRLANRLFNILISKLVNVLFDAKLTDEATGYKVIDVELMRDLKLEANGFDICAEMTAKILRRGVAIYEVPISYSARTVQNGKKVRLRDAGAAVYTVLKYRWAHVDVGAREEA